MKRVPMVLGVIVVCLPMLFVAWLLLAARWTKVDAITVHLPMGMRQMVAKVAAQRAAWDDRKAYERIVVLDPKSAVGWDGLCSSDGVQRDAKTELENCIKAVALDDNAGDENVVGKALEKLGNPCAAAEAYRKASVKSSGGWVYPENMGQAALRCGDLPLARAGLETAVENLSKTLANPDSDDDDKKDAKEALSTDHEFLIVVYDTMKQPKLAATMCSAEHADWKGCHCAVDKDGAVACEQKAR